MKLAEEMKKNQEAEKKKCILLDTFASGDEKSDIGSDWEVEEAVYSLNDEEEVHHLMIK